MVNSGFLQAGYQVAGDGQVTGCAWQGMTQICVGEFSTFESTATNVEEKNCRVRGLGRFD